MKHVTRTSGQRSLSTPHHAPPLDQIPTASPPYFAYKISLAFFSVLPILKDFLKGNPEGCNRMNAFEETPFCDTTV